MNAEQPSVSILLDSLTTCATELLNPQLSHSYRRVGWTSWLWAGRGSRLQISLTCRPCSASVTRIQLDPWQSVICSVCQLKRLLQSGNQWSCLYAGVWKHWHVMCQPAACQQLPSLASGDRQFTVCPIMLLCFSCSCFLRPTWSEIVA